jgi:DNA adenine methylase
MDGLSAPFPWFGGKSRASHLVWSAFGDVSNYVEPFAGSLAVLLARPRWHGGCIERVNDIDCYIANFWRALRSDAAAVCDWACESVNEADLHARHQWLVSRHEFRESVKTDPHFYDAKVAGWWLWGISAWIGGGWCDEKYYSDERLQAKCVTRPLPEFGTSGGGVHRLSIKASKLGRKVELMRYLGRLSDRMQSVDVACGDWKRVLGATLNNCGAKPTGVFLDPPYLSRECKQQYSVNTGDCAERVAQWAFENGDRPELRIALCGYRGNYTAPAGWVARSWKPRAGYANTERAHDNRSRETILFSPHCLAADGIRQLGLFEGG